MLIMGVLIIQIVLPIVFERKPEILTDKLKIRRI